MMIISSLPGPPDGHPTHRPWAHGGWVQSFPGGPEVIIFTKHHLHGHNWLHQMEITGTVKNLQGVSSTSVSSYSGQGLSSPSQQTQPEAQIQPSSLAVLEERRKLGNWFSTASARLPSLPSLPSSSSSSLWKSSLLVHHRQQHVFIVIDTIAIAIAITMIVVLIIIIIIITIVVLITAGQKQLILARLSGVRQLCTNATLLELPLWGERKKSGDVLENKWLNLNPIFWMCLVQNRFQQLLRNIVSNIAILLL